MTYDPKHEMSREAYDEFTKLAKEIENTINLTIMKIADDTKASQRMSIPLFRNAAMWGCAMALANAFGNVTELEGEPLQRIIDQCARFINDTMDRLSKEHNLDMLVWRYDDAPATEFDFGRWG